MRTKKGRPHQKCEWVLPRIKEIISKGEYIYEEPLDSKVIYEILELKRAFQVVREEVEYKTKDRGSKRTNKYSRNVKVYYKEIIKKLNPKEIAELYIQLWEKKHNIEPTPVDCSGQAQQGE